MPKTNTKYTSQHIDNQSFDDDFQVKLTGHIKYDDPANPTSISRTNLATEETLQAVLAASGGTTYNYVKMDEGATYTYFGYTSTTGWQIKRMTNADTSLLYADGLFSGTYADFDTAWAARASITYAYTT